MRLALDLLFAKTPADCKINHIAAALALRVCYNSCSCVDSLLCASERWVASCAHVAASSSRIWHYANHLSCGSVGSRGPAWVSSTSSSGWRLGGSGQDGNPR